MENRRKIGTNYERLAGKYLEAHGYQIIEYNFKCNAGEIDIIAKDQEKDGESRLPDGSSITGEAAKNFKVCTVLRL